MAPGLALSIHTDDANTAVGSSVPSSGTRFTGGRVAEEYLAEWQHDARADTVERMVTDPQVAGHLAFFKTPLQEATWRIEPAADDERSKEIAERCAAATLRQGDRRLWMLTSWRQRLGEIIDGMSEHGHALFFRERHFVTEPVPTQTFRRFVWLHPRSIDRWHIDNQDNWLGVLRSYTQVDGQTERWVQDEFVPAGDLMLYIHDPRGMNLDGRAKIRSLWRPFKLKDIAERIEALDITRRGAPMPIGKYSSDTPGDKERQRMESSLKMMRGEAPDDGWLTIGPDNEIGYMEQKGTIKEQDPVIERKINDMAAAMQTGFLQLGATKTGARAVADPLMRFAMLPLNSFAKQICDHENEGILHIPGPIQEWVDMNYSGITEYPRMVCEKINPMEHLETIPTALEALAVGPQDMGVVAPVLVETFERLGYEVPERLREMAENPDDFAPAVPPPIDPVDDGEDDEPAEPDGEPVPDEGPPQNPASAAQITTLARRFVVNALKKQKMKIPDGLTVAFLDRHDLDMDLRDAKNRPEGDKLIDAPPGGRRHPNFFRLPTPFESRFVALTAVENALNSFQARLGRSMVDGKHRLSDELIDRVRRGGIRISNVDSIGKKDGPVIRVGPSIRGSIRPTFRKLMRFGRVQVRDELRRQHRVRRQQLARVEKVEGGDLWGKAVRNGETAISVSVTEMIDDVVGSFSAEYIRLANRGLELGDLADELEGFVDQLSDPVQQARGAALTSIAFNQGRNVEIQARRDEVAFVIRSELLDGNTCSVCADLDGRKYNVGTDAYWDNFPPAKCKGRERCRGFYVVVADEELEAA